MKTMNIEGCQIYEIIKNSLPIGFTLVDEEGVIVDFNPKAEVITGYLKSEVIGQSHLEILHGTTDRAACPLFLYAIQKKQQSAAVETNIKNKDGDLITIMASISPIFDEDQNFIGGIELFRDITKIKKLERERKNILPMFAHDMKTPVITAGGFLSRLLAGKVGSLTEQQVNTVHIIRDELTKVEELITDFLEFSRFDATEYRPLKSAFNIEDAINSQIEEAGIEAAKKNIHISFEYPNTLVPVIYADGRMIDRVLSNLLDNAVKYSQHDTTIVVKLNDWNLEVQVQVVDEGVGISEEHLPYIFDAFYRVNRDSGGSGLGLSIVKTIIEAHSGKIWVKSAPGKGSTFSFTLPKNGGS
ncbi:MAG: PAS domain-containing sensor histidine kinase [Thermodesulfovibrionales bacterium]|nr:PAS domain-containing sensor histidine kinase [Thermodesulfovibrionales bacterium]